MRPSITLDDDVVAMLDRLMASSTSDYRLLANNLLRESLQLATERSVRRPEYRTPSSDAGKCLVDSIADVEQVLADVEGPARR